MLDLPLTDTSQEANSFTGILRLAFAISGKIFLMLSDAAILKEGPPSTSSLFAIIGTSSIKLKVVIFHTVPRSPGIV
jgi:hypothetical protein